MSRLVLLTSNEALAKRVLQILGDGLLVEDPQGGVPPYGHFFTANTSEPYPFLFLVDMESFAPEVVWSIPRDYLQSDVVFLYPHPEAVALNSLRSGAADVLSTECSPEELLAAVQVSMGKHHAARGGEQEHHVPNREEEEGEVIAVVSPKGGAGKTFVATNLAVLLAAHNPGRVVLADLDIYFGDVSSNLNLTPEFTLPDCLQGQATRDTVALKSLLSHHDKSKVFVIPGTDNPTRADGIEPEACDNLLKMLESQFRFVVVDTSPGISEHTLTALDRASHAIFVSTLDVPSVRSLKKELKTLDELGMDSAKRLLFLNFSDPRAGMTVKDAEQALGMTATAVVPYSSSIKFSVNQGVPLAQVAPTSPIGTELSKLAQKLDPTILPKKSLFKR